MKHMGNFPGFSLTREIERTVKRVLRRGDAARERTTGRVTRVDSSGVIWVNLSGSDSETPCAMTSAAVKPADIVPVTISRGVAVIDGNYTSPATDDTVANSALETGSSAKRVANTARKMSESAIADAEAAHEAAQSAAEYAATASEKAEQASEDAAAVAESLEQALEDAADAKEAAEQAQTDAASAASSASTASQSAYNAQISSSYANAKLSDVENVVGMFDWIESHATYELTTDTTPVDGRLYWQRSGTSPNYSYTPVREVPMTYTATTDTTVVSGKTYYELVSGQYVEVTPTGDEDPSDEGWYEGARNPQASGLYVLDVDESIDGYIAAHAAMTPDGLMLTGADATTQVLLCTNPNSESYELGVHIMSGGSTVGYYGEDAIIGREDGAHITVGTVKDYMPTSDLAVVSGKTYYTRSSTQPYTYTQVASPVTADIGTYYEYVDVPEIGFYQGNNRVAYITRNEMYIPRVVVVDSMRVGDWQWERRDNGNLRLAWIGD